MIKLNKTKLRPKLKTFKSFDEILTYRQEVLLKANARSRTFNDQGYNYYWFRLQEVDNLIKSSLFNELGLVLDKTSIDYDIK